MRHWNLLTLVLGLMVVATPAVVSAQWVTTVTDSLAGTPASERSTRFSVVVDAANAPHAVWTAGSSMFYSRKQAGGWIAPI